MTAAAPPDLSAIAKAVGERAAEIVDAYWRRLCAVPGMPEDARLALAVAFQRDWMARTEREATARAAPPPAPFRDIIDRLDKLRAGLSPADAAGAVAIGKVLERLPEVIEAFSRGWAAARGPK